MYAGMTCLELLGFRVKTNGKTFHPCEGTFTQLLIPDYFVVQCD